jgi:hypothetical protein
MVHRVFAWFILQKPSPCLTVCLDGARGIAIPSQQRPPLVLPSPAKFGRAPRDEPAPTDLILVDDVAGWR